MVTAIDKAGHKVFVDYTPDCEYNEGGFYCETFADEDGADKIDDFCIHPEDCDCTDEEAVEEYIRNYYKDEVLDLEFSFD